MLLLNWIIINSYYNHENIRAKIISKHISFLAFITFYFVYLKSQCYLILFVNAILEVNTLPLFDIEALLFVVVAVFLLASLAIKLSVWWCIIYIFAVFSDHSYINGFKYHWVIQCYSYFCINNNSSHFFKNIECWRRT